MKPPNIPPINLDELLRLTLFPHEYILNSLKEQPKQETDKNESQAATGIK
jgi:hypothetical protein